jgi:DNA replication protein DnaC
LHELLLARADGTYVQLLAKLARFDVLVIDDFGLAVLSEQERTDLLELIEHRAETRSTILTSQFPFEHWYERIGDPTIADAICDRLLHNAYKIVLGGRRAERRRPPRNPEETQRRFAPSPLVVRCSD